MAKKKLTVTEKNKLSSMTCEKVSSLKWRVSRQRDDLEREITSKVRTSPAYKNLQKELKEAEVLPNSIRTMMYDLEIKAFKEAGLKDKVQIHKIQTHLDKYEEEIRGKVWFEIETHEEAKKLIEEVREQVKKWKEKLGIKEEPFYV